MTPSAQPVTKLQTKLPTSMRYDRVQVILEDDPFCRIRLSPKTQAVETRFGEKVVYSKEVVEVTEALHAEGKDAHKVPKNEVLKAALRIMKSSGNHAPPAVSVAPPPPPPAPPAAEGKPKKKAKAAKPEPPPAPPPSPPPPPAKKANKPKKPEAKLQPPAPAPAKKVKAEAPKTAPAVATPPPPAPPPVPESELPIEKQPLKLPPDFDPSKYPHYSVQSSIYSLLLSALNMSEHYEKYPDAETRQKILDDLVRRYQETCDPLKIKA
jgi:hypothetical protein